MASTNTGSDRPVQPNQAGQTPRKSWFKLRKIGLSPYWVTTWLWIAGPDQIMRCFFGKPQPGPRHNRRPWPAQVAASEAGEFSS